MPPEFVQRAVARPKCRYYEDFEPGREFVHHWGRTINEGDNSLLTTLTMYFNPLCFNAEFAKAHGHAGVVVNPFLVFTTVFGLSVQDLSESGGAFLGVEGLEFGVPVYPGDTLEARSTVVDRRPSSTHAGMGIATWHTRGFNQRGEKVVDFKRTNMIARREHQS
jgi:itaconyl-CoA hydratase